MFNDTYNSFSRNNNNVTVNKKDISWKSDIEHKFGSEGQSEMKLFGKKRRELSAHAEVLKQHFGRKIVELEDEKRAVQQERDHLLAEVENLAASCDGQPQKSEDIHAQKLKTLETQILDLKKKQESQIQLLKQKQKSNDAAKRLQDEIQSIKAQKVQLQQKIKQEANSFGSGRPLERKSCFR